jgi:hypothetical protein
MNGTVYIFNAFTQKVTLTVNNQASKTMMIPGITSRPYVPFSTQTSRSDPNQGGLFINGQSNQISIIYQGGQVQANVNIPSAATGTPGLWLYLFSECVLLFDTAGTLLEEDPLTLSAGLHAALEGELPDGAFSDEEISDR